MTIVEEARTRTTLPPVSREPGQKSIDDPLWLARVRFPFPVTQPEWIKAQAWRGVVKRQPVCVDCRRPRFGGNESCHVRKR